MKNLTLRNITKACHGEYRGPENLLDKEVAGVTIDSRKVEKDYAKQETGNLPIRGPD